MLNASCRCLSSYVCLWLFLGLIACQADQPLAEKAPEPVLKSIKITTVHAKRADVVVYESVLGRVIDPKAITVAAEVPAQLVAVYKKLGDTVAKGELLAQLDPHDSQAALATAKAHLDGVRARLQAQQRLLARYQQLEQHHFVSVNMLDQTKAQLIHLKKSEHAAKIQWQHAKLQLQRCRIVSPIDARVHKRLVSAGSYIGMGKPVFQLVSDRALEVKISIPETRLQAVHLGQIVRLRLPNAKTWIMSKIHERSPIISQSSNALEARVFLPKGVLWPIGASVVAEIQIAKHKQALLVPETAIVLRPKGDVVYEIVQQKAVEHVLRLGHQQQGWVEVLEGVNMSMLLADRGAAFLTQAAPVTIQQP